MASGGKKNVRPPPVEEHGAGAGQEGNLLAQLRHALVTAEQHSFETERFKRQIQAERDACSKLEGKLFENERALNDSKARLQQAEMFAEQQKQHICRLQSTVEENKRIKSVFESTVSALQSRVKSLDAGYESKTKEAEKLKEMSEKLLSEKRDALLAKEELQASYHEHKKAHELTVKELEKRCIALQKAVQQAQEGGKTVQARLAQLSEEYKRADQREKDLRETNGLLKQQVAGCAKTEADLRDTLVGLRKANEDASARISQSSERVKSLESKVQQYGFELSETRSKLQRAESQSEEKVEGVKAKLEQVRREKQLQKQELEGLLSQVGEDLSDLKKARSEEMAKMREAHTNQVTQLQAQLKEMSEGAQSQYHALQAKENAYREVVRERNGLRERCDSLSSKLKAEELALRQAKSQLSRNAQDLDKKDKEAAKNANALRAEVARAHKAKEKSEKQLLQVERETEKVRTQLAGMQNTLTQERKQWQLAQTALEAELATLNEGGRELQQQKEKLTNLLQEANEASKTQDKVFKERVSQLREEAEKQAREWQDRRQGLLRNLEVKQRNVKELEGANAALLKEVADLRVQAKVRDDELSAELAKARELQAEMKERLKGVQNEVEQRTRDAASQQQLQAQKYQEQIREISLDRERDKDRIASLQDRRARLEAELEKMQHSTAGQVLELNDKAKTLYRENEELRSKRSGLESKIRSLTKREETAQMQAKSSIADLENAKREWALRYEKCEADLQKSRKDKAAKDLEVVQLQQNFDEEKRRLVAQAQSEQDELRNAIEGVRYKSNSLAQQVEDLTEQNAALEQRAKAALRENKELKENESNLMALYKNMARSGPSRPETEDYSDDLADREEDQEEKANKQRSSRKGNQRRTKLSVHPSDMYNRSSNNNNYSAKGLADHAPAILASPYSSLDSDDTEEPDSARASGAGIRIPRGRSTSKRKPGARGLRPRSAKPSY